MKFIHFLILSTFLLLAGCRGAVVAAPEIMQTAADPTVTLTPFQPKQNTPQPRLASTSIPATFDFPSPTPGFPSNPTSLETPNPGQSEPESLNVPVLLYHHIAISPTNSSYYTTPENFEAQMKLLYSEGYTTISTEMLIEAITDGTQLPEKPVIITFDDGNISVFTTAFPIMYNYNFSGVAYVVYKYLGAEGFMNVDQIKSLANNGWEIGSHGYEHADLLEDPGKQGQEIFTSRQLLEKELGLPVLTFAYPFGRLDRGAVDRVKRAGYIAAFGIENNHKHAKENLFYLQRLEVKGNYDIGQFIALLSKLDDSIREPVSIPQP